MKTKNFKTSHNLEILSILVKDWYKYQKFPSNYKKYSRPKWMIMNTLVNKFEVAYNLRHYMSFLKHNCTADKMMLRIFYNK